MKKFCFAALLSLLLASACDNVAVKSPAPDIAAKPYAEPAGGEYAEAQTVVLSTGTSEADIYYTVDGVTDPSKSSAKYSGPIAIGSTTTLMAVAVKGGMEDSEIMTEVYSIALPEQAAKPEASPAGGNYPAPQTVALSTATAGADIYYTTDGATMPTRSSAKYSGPIIIGEDATLMAVAVKSGLLDSDIMSEAYAITLPYLTIQNIPADIAARQISNISVYDINGMVASCINSDDIILVIDNDAASLQIPLLHSFGGGQFLETGSFFIAFAVDVGDDFQVAFSRNDGIAVDFVGGSASFDLASSIGYFDAELANPGDGAAPIIKMGSVFDINGSRHAVPTDLAVPASPPANSCILYLYVFRSGADIQYEFSSAAPAFNSMKNGYYSGNKRALWKMFYMHENSQFLFKTYVADNFPQFDTAVVSNAVYDSLTSSRPALHSIGGTGSQYSETITLQPGVYAVRLIGAGGGGGYGAVEGSAVTGSSSGGAGGLVNEIFTLGKAESFTAFTGSGGYAASAPASSGAFRFYGYKGVLRWVSVWDSEYYRYEYAVFPDYPNIYSDQTVSITIQPAGSGGGGGGGGGGSGSFLFSDSGYLLCAGGGGGGSGASFVTPGGAGGAGGAIGPGSGGGGAGYLRQFFQSPATMAANGGNGGNGGGNGGIGGRVNITPSAQTGGNGISVIPYTNTYASGGTGAYSYSAFTIPSSLVGTFSYAGYGHSLNSMTAIEIISVENYTIFFSGGFGGSSAAISYPPGFYSWLNTNDAHGAGSSSPALGLASFSGMFNTSGTSAMSAPSGFSYRTFNNYTSTIVLSMGKYSGISGSAGGNNRNSARGGGAAGGSVSSSRPSNGAAGSITIYKIY